MENKHYPDQAPEFLPLDQALPSDPDSAMDLPLIEELNFTDTPEPIALTEEICYPEERIAEEPLQPDDSEADTEAPAIAEAQITGNSFYPEEEPAFWVSEAETDIPAEPVAEPIAESVTESATEPVAEPVAAESVTESPEETVAQESDLIAEILNNPEFAPVEPAVVSEEEPVTEEYRDAAPEANPEEAPAKGKKKKKAEAGRPTLKGRPKRKKGEGLFGIPNILVTFVWLALILAIGVTLGRMLWVCAADVLAFGRPDQKVTITVYEADTMEDVINKLHANGLIRYKSLFSLYAEISDAEEDIKPGIYDLNTRYDYHALVNFMSPSSTREVIKLTIPEGYTCRQIFALLEENRVCTAQDIAAYAADGELSDYWFLEDVQRGSEYCLEGFLFPDTYQFYKNSSPREALDKMLSNFDNRFNEEMRAQIETLNANVTGGGYGVREIVIVASLIEKESAAPAESPTIASVIYNRLHNWDYPALLNIDAAIVYAQGGESDTIDTGIDSPYNTYLYTGLTPTPIANPGLSSLKAALNPETTKYYFYVLNPATGMHQFSTTQAEHDGWIQEFYN